MMSGKPAPDRRTRRHAATQREIVDAAWSLVREQGLTSWSMRELGERVGMRAQSVYSYFASKHDVYDALFLDGNRAFVEQMASVTGGDTDDHAVLLVRAAEAFIEFCASDPVRHQLLFQRTIPDFTPSTESYAAAEHAYGAFREQLAAIGVTSEASLDLWSATLAGIAAQQISNDPGGDRWTRLVDRAVAMLLDDARRHEPQSHRPTLLEDA